MIYFYLPQRGIEDIPISRKGIVLSTIALIHKMKEPDGAWSPKKLTVVLEITLSESYARLYRDVELVRVGHLAALRITIEGRLAVQDTQTPT